jgi:hypothetical protein
MGWSLVQGVLPTVHRLGNWKSAKAHKGYRAIERIERNRLLYVPSLLTQKKLLFTHKMMNTFCGQKISVSSMLLFLQWTANVSLNSVNNLVFSTETECFLFKYLDQLQTAKTTEVMEQSPSWEARVVSRNSPASLEGEIWSTWGRTLYSDASLIMYLTWKGL